LKLYLDPLIDIVSPVADVLGDTKCCWTPASMPPPVHGVERHIQVVGEVLGAEQVIESFHLHIVDRAGFDEITDSCQALLAKGCGGFITNAVGALLSISPGRLPIT